MTKRSLLLVLPLAAVLVGCGDNRLRQSPYLKTASNDQAGDSSLPGAGANNPSGGAGGSYNGETSQHATSHIPTSDSTGMTDAGSGKGKGEGAMTGDAARSEDKKNH